MLLMLEQTQTKAVTSGFKWCFRRPTTTQVNAIFCQVIHYVAWDLTWEARWTEFSHCCIKLREYKPFL